MIFLPLNLKSAKDCISMEATYMGQQNRHAFTCGIFHITFFDPSQCKRYKANMSQYPFIYSNYLNMVSKINNTWTFFSLHYGDKKKGIIFNLLCYTPMQTDSYAWASPQALQHLASLGATIGRIYHTFQLISKIHSLN